MVFSGYNHKFRARKEMEVKSILEDEQSNHLEQQVKEAKYIAEDADRKYEEVDSGIIWWKL